MAETAPVVIAIDGPDCAGKTRLANLVQRDVKRKTSVMTIHQDDYLNDVICDPQSSLFTAREFYHAYFDQDALRTAVLAPARRAKKLGGPWPSVTIVEGLFLLRRSMLEYYDLTVRIEVKPETIIQRALKRDVGVIGDRTWVLNHYTIQCIPAQSIYMREENPGQVADILLISRDDGDLTICR